MTFRNDQTYLLNEQYRDASNLGARAALHARFSTNQYGWHQWVFDQMVLPEKARVLELGSGPGWLWHANADRIPSGWAITLSDFSPGMVAESQRTLAGVGRVFEWRQIDAQQIPADDGAFDAVIANHMLYHVPDRARALTEIARVLAPEGVFFAATNGVGHMREIADLGGRFEAMGYALQSDWRSDVAQQFALENGAAQLGAVFAQVELRRYADALVVTEAEPLVAYIASTVRAEHLTDDLLAALRQFIATEMSKTGAIDITKDTGLFIARK